MANEILTTKIVVGSTVQSGPNNGKDALKTSKILHNALINSVSTGIVSQYAVTINADPTKIDIGSFKAVFSPNNHTDGIALLPTEVDYIGVTALVLSDILTNHFTYIGLASNGSLTQQNTPFTTLQKKATAPICVAFHPNTTVLKVASLFTPATNTASQIQDLFDVIGSENINGNHIIKGTGGFNITKEVGSTLRGGSNSVDLDDANRVTNALLTDADIYYSYIDSGEADGYKIESAVSNIDLTKWDDGSDTLATISGKKATIQRGYYLPHLHIVVVEYGQTNYKDFDDASINISQDITSHKRNPILDASSLRLYLVGSAQASDLDSAEVEFKNTNGSTATSGGDSVTLRTGLDRLDRSEAISASVTNVIDPVIAKFHVITMDADLLLLTFTNQPTKEGTELVLMIDWDGTPARTITVNGAKFRGGLDVGVPNANGVINTRDYVHCFWNAKDSIFDIVGKVSRYP